ncbi:MAG TPA: helix-turn-helix domain-containing protein [Gammaproteobacteria bacterium]|jgi:AcrR family transcriptional regulator|nr:helix-turn-helix domain-containing protein [Gammaproteobacteria bacterium]
MAKRSTARTDPRRDRTREALLSAGRSLFAHRDVDGVSVDEIVEAAAVAKGSFYNHFADKEVFAREIAASARREAEALVNEVNAGVEDPAVAVARALCVFVRFAMERRDSARTLWRLNTGATMVDAPINRGLVDVVQHGIDKGAFSHVDVETGILLVMGTIVITLRHLFEERVRTEPGEIAQRMAAGLLRSLGVAAGRADRLAREATLAVLG